MWKFNGNFDSPNWQKKLQESEKEIKNALKSYHLKSLDYVDVSGNCLYIQGTHERVPAYYFLIVPFDRNFDDIELATNNFISQWKQMDSDPDIDTFENMIKQGEKYGWE